MFNNEKRAEENKSSAYTLTSIGGVGVIGVILVFIGVIPIPLSAYNRYMTCGVLMAMFVLFFIIGVLSFRSSKVFAEKAKTDSSLSEKIHSWCLTNMKPQQICDAVDQGGTLPQDTNKEELYFLRVRYMKDTILENFMNLEDEFLDQLIDELYDEYFE